MPPTRSLSTALPLLVIVPLLPTRAVSSGDCSAFQADVARDSYRAAATLDACSDYVVAAGTQRWVDWPCDDDACALVMRDTAQTLPDCQVDGVNLRANVTAAIARCVSAGASDKIGASTGAAASTHGRQGGQGLAAARLGRLILVVGLSFFL